MPTRSTPLAQQSLPNQTQPSAAGARPRSGSATAKAGLADSRTGERTASKTPTARSRAASASATSRSASHGPSTRPRSTSTASAKAAAAAAGPLDASATSTTTGGPLSAPRIRFASLHTPSANAHASAGAGTPSRRGSSAALTAPSLGEAGATAPVTASTPDAEVGLTTPPTSEARAARHRPRGLSVLSSTSSPAGHTRGNDVDGAVGPEATADASARSRGHPFPLRPVSPRKPSLGAHTRGSLDSTVTSQGTVEAALGVPLVSGSPSLTATPPRRAAVPAMTTAALAATAGGDEDKDDDETTARRGAPPAATPPHPPRRPSTYVVPKSLDDGLLQDDREALHHDDADADDDASDLLNGEPMLVDTTGHSPISPQLQRRVAQEQRKERERIRRRLNPSARTLRLSARLRTAGESSARHSRSPHESLARDDDDAPDLGAHALVPTGLAQPSPRSGKRTSVPGDMTTPYPQPDRTVPQPAARPALPPLASSRASLEVTALIEDPNLLGDKDEDDDAEEPEPTAPTPTAAAAAGGRSGSGSAARRVVKSRPHHSGSRHTSAASSASRSQSQLQSSPGPADPCPSTTVPIAHAQVTLRATPEPSADTIAPVPAPQPSGEPRTVVKQPAPHVERRAAAKSDASRLPQTTKVVPASSSTASSSSSSAVLASRVRRRPGATLTRLKRDGAAPSSTAGGTASTVAISSGTTTAAPSAAAPTTAPTPTSAPRRVMKAPDSMLHAASETHASPLQSVGCVPSITAGQDLLPPLSLADRHRTFTIVFDLDETMCNNRTLGPALLRPGVLVMLDDLRSLGPPPTYMSPDEVAAAGGSKVSATTRLYEQAVARQLGCGPATTTTTTTTRGSSHSPPAGAPAPARRRRSTSPCAVPPDTALHTPSWTDAELERGPRVELVVWTASVESVARTVLTRLDPDGNIFDQCVFRDARWYREVSYTKDLRRLGRVMEHVTIVENAPSAVALNRSHAILVNDFVSNRSDRQLYTVRTILRDWIEQARLSVQLPPRPIGHTDADLATVVANEYLKRHDAAVLSATTSSATNAADGAAEAPLTVSAASQRRSSAVGGGSGRSRANSTTLSSARNGASPAVGPERPEELPVMASITHLLTHHPLMSNATGYVNLTAGRQVMPLYKDEIPRRRERGSRGSMSRSGSSAQQQHLSTTAPGSLGTMPGMVGRPTAIAASKAARAALKKKTTVTTSAMAHSSVALPGPVAAASVSANSSATNSRTVRRADPADAVTAPLSPPPPPTSSALSRRAVTVANGTSAEAVPAAAAAPTAETAETAARTKPAGGTATLARAPASRTSASAAAPATGTAPSAAARTRSTKRGSRPGWVK